jgi:hypothetical protein
VPLGSSSQSDIQRSWLRTFCANTPRIAQESRKEGESLNHVAVRRLARKEMNRPSRSRSRSCST